MLSAKWKHCMSGVETADSLAWNPHKMSGATLQTSAFLVRHGDDLLSKTNGTQAAYLFQPDKLYVFIFLSLSLSRSFTVFAFIVLTLPLLTAGTVSTTPAIRPSSAAGRRTC